MNNMDVLVPIPGSEGYFATRDGRIFSSRRRRTVELRQCMDSWGYKSLSILVDGRLKTTRVHILILKAFQGPRPPNAVSRHLDGNKENNSASNLAWGTQSQNVLDCVKHGTQICLRRGADRPMAKLQTLDVIAIREHYKRGHYTQAKLGQMFGIDQTTVSIIVTGKQWTHVPL